MLKLSVPFSVQGNILKFLFVISTLSVELHWRIPLIKFCDYAITDICIE